MKKTALATAIALSLGNGIAYGVDMNSATFIMLSINGANINPDGNDTTVTGSIGGGTWTVESSRPFFGSPWDAHDGVTFGPGTYTIPSVEGGTYTGIEVGPNQVGGHILFDWGGNNNIDVVNVWDITNNGNGTLSYNSTDVIAGPGVGPNTPITAPSGVIGLEMVDGPFVGSNANFNFRVDGSINTPPTAENIAANTTEDTPVDIDLAGNSSDPDGNLDPSSAAVQSPPSDGSVQNNGDGTVTYTPDAGFTGQDSFTYTIKDTDNAESNEATVTINVTAAGVTPPDAVDDTATTPVDTPVDIDVLANDSDPNGEDISIFDFDPASTNGGTVEQNADDTLKYTPPAGFTGTDTFNYSVVNVSGGVDTATVTISVGEGDGAPECDELDLKTDVDGELKITEAEMLSVCTDPNGNELIVIKVDQPTVPGSTVSSDGAGTYTYTPASGFEGSDSFDYTVGTEAATPTAAAGLETVNTVSIKVGEGEIYGNFTMLNTDAVTFGGTNDVVAEWDGSVNTAVSDTNMNLEFGSESNFPFFGFPWSAHDGRVFGPGTYTFDTNCNGAQIRAGITDCGGGTPLKLVVELGQLGVHVLFDWNVTADIDVAMVWEENAAFEHDNPRGQLYQGPAGPTPTPDAIFQQVSRDGDGDGVPGIGMVDGPFIGFRANFNLNFDKSDSGGGTAVIPTSNVQSPSLGGCTINSKPVSPVSRGDWWLVGGFLAWMGMFVRRRKKQAH